MKVTTGHDPRLGTTLTQRAHELLRRGAYGHAEQTNQPVTSGLPRTIAIHRSVVTAAGDSAARIPRTWAQVAGLDAIAGTIWLPAPWSERPSETEIPLRESERMVTLVDIPATAAEGEDVVLLTDRLSFDDPIYGADSVFNVERIHALPDGVTHVRVMYAHADEAAS